VLLVLFRRQLRPIITVDGITHITTEAITTHITTEGNTTDIAIAGTTIGTGPGLSARMGVQGIIAIGKPGRGFLLHDVQFRIVAFPHGIAKAGGGTRGILQRRSPIIKSSLRLERMGRSALSC
jgi:hypothetical protein